MAHRATHARLSRAPDAPSSSRAWPRAVSVTRSPASMRAISSTRASPASPSTATRERPARTVLVTRTWWPARPAIGARWVTQSTWRPSATAASFCATTEATRPPMPASTSSKTIVGTRSAFARTVVSPSIVRESSPPEATRASGRTSSPGLVESRNSTRSSPRGDTSSSSARSSPIRKRERSMPSARSSRSTAGPRRSAAARRRSESAATSARPAVSLSACWRRRRSCRSSSSSPGRRRAASSSESWKRRRSSRWARSRSAARVRSASARASRNFATRPATPSRSSSASAKRSRSSSWRAGSSRRWCSCWPCTSTRWSPRRSRSATVTAASLTKARWRPERLSSRRATSTPSSGASPASSSVAPTAPRGSTSKTASTVAASASLRITSVWARAPRTNKIASMSIDFPAPVSPVRTLSPGRNSTATLSMTAKFRMRSSRSIENDARSLAAAAQVVSGGRRPLALPPLQLGPEDREELLLRETHEANPRGGLHHPHGVVLPEAYPDLAVHGDHDVLVRHERDLDPMHSGEDDRPVRQGVGADRRQHDRVHRRKQDRPTGGEAVGGRAGRRRDDQAVGAVRGGVLPLDRHREVDDAAHRRLGDNNVVEGGVLPEPLAVPDDPYGQHHALVHLHPAREQRFERREHLVERRRGEESEPAEVHAEQRHAEVADRARHGEEGAVAAEDDEQGRVRR